MFGTINAGMVVAYFAVIAVVVAVAVLLVRRNR